MDRLGMWHTVFASLSLLLGAVVLLRRKADRLHRTVGHLYIASMLATCITALNIYDLFGRFGPFHAAAIVSLSTVIAAVVPVVSRRPRARWFELHAYFMSWSYVGLLAAAASEAAVRIPSVPFAPGALVATVVVSLAGGGFIHWRGGWLVRLALRKAGVVPVLVALADVRVLEAQDTISAVIDHRRTAVDVAVSRVDASALLRERKYLSELAARHPTNGLLLHYLGYAWYREATIGSRSNRGVALDSAQSILARSARLLALAETHALLSTIVGYQIDGSPWRGMLHGGRVSDEMERAIALGPKNPRVALQQGINAYHAPAAFGGGDERARRAFERAVSLFRSDRPAPAHPTWGWAEAWAWLGRTKLRSGDTAGARAAYDSALVIDPSYAWVARVLRPRVAP